LATVGASGIGGAGRDGIVAAEGGDERGVMGQLRPA